MEFDTSKLTKESLEIAKRASHEVWEKYDDKFGYKNEKQERNKKVKTDNPENIWFFLGQFDPNNQQELLLKIILSEPENDAKFALMDFVSKYLNWQAEEIKKVKEEYLSKKN